MKKIIGLLAATLLAIAGCSTYTTGPDEVAIHQDGGPIAGKSIKGCQDPGVKEYDNFADAHFSYPSRQVTWDFTNAEKGEADPVSVTDSEGVTLHVPGITTFSLNIECENLKEFHRRIGLKYEAYTKEGWNDMLRAYMGNPLEKALDQASQRYTWRELLQDEKVRDEWEAEVGKLARGYAQDQAGADYFCSPTYTGDGECGDFALTLQKPILPESISDALAQTAAEIELKNQAENAQERIDVEAESLKALVDVLGPEAAVLYQAIKEGQVNVVPVPAGSDILVDGTSTDTE